MNKSLLERVPYVLVWLVISLAACQTVQPTVAVQVSRPRVELISPPSGVRVVLGEELEVQTQTTDARGLDRIELWVDDSIYRVDEVGGAPSFLVIQRWRADKPGERKLTVKAINVDDLVSAPLNITVEVLDPASFTATPTPMALPSPTPTLTSTPTPVPSSTPTATAVPSPTPTPTSADTARPTETPTVTTPPPTKTPAPSGPTGMVFIPEGKFLMGSNADHVQQAADWCKCGSERFQDELYMHEVFVSGFYIDKTEVTNQQFLAFVNTTGYQSDAEKKNEVKTWRTEFTPGKENHPVVWMSWNDANAYCQWAGKRLPTEAEWEKAARGTDGRLWPWGGEWDKSRLNMREGGRQTTTPVDSFPKGASPYGVMDMAGNVWEWVNDWYVHNAYQLGQNTDPKGPDGGQDRVLRGGGFNNGVEDVRVANRHKGGPSGYAPDHGFRCAK